MISQLPALSRRSTYMSSTIILCLFLVSQSATATDADQAMEQIATDYLNDIATFGPIGATSIGDHRRDHELDDLSAVGRRNYLKAMNDYGERLGRLDWDQLSRENQIDAAILNNKVASSIFATKTLQEWAWNPMYYVNRSGSALYGLMARDFAPVDERLMSAASRLEKLPEMFAQARSELQPERVPKIHAETAVAQNKGVLSIIEQMIVPELNSLTADQRVRMDAAIESATLAVAEQQEWLEQELLPRAAGDFRIGAKSFDEKLSYTLNSPLTRKDIMERAENEYTSVRDQMYEISKGVYAEQHPYSTFPDSPDDAFKQVIIRAALEQAYRQLPDPDGIVEIANEFMQQATDFVIEKNIVTMPDEPVEIIVMPEFQRGVSFAYLDSAGPLDENAETFYAVAPIPTDWTDQQVESFLREYNLRSVQALTIHEGVPGHYLQLALSNRYPSTLRAVLWSGTFVEGWGVYAERVMVEEGYLDYDPLMALINLKWYLRSVTNAIMDQAIHVDGMSRDAAMKLMIEGGFQEEREAAGKWVRAQLTSTQLSTYFVGFQEHMDLRETVREAWGDEFTLRRYHDQALSYGSPPVKYVRALMLGEAIPE